MDEVKKGLQYIFQTNNRLTLALSASGHGGMEACLTNLVEPGETVLIVKGGIWSQRATCMANRLGANVCKNKLRNDKIQNNKIYHDLNYYINYIQILKYR